MARSGGWEGREGWGGEAGQAAGWVGGWVGGLAGRGVGGETWGLVLEGGVPHNLFLTLKMATEVRGVCFRLSSHVWALPCARAPPVFLFYFYGAPCVFGSTSQKT